MKKQTGNRKSDRKKPTKGQNKTSPKTKEQKKRFPGPDKPVDEKSVYIAGALIHSVYVDVDIPGKVDVMLAVLASEVLDAAGHDQIEYYRFIMDSDDSMISQEFFEGKEVPYTGSYSNQNFQVPFVVEGTLYGTDANPEDLSRPISVLKDVKLQHLIDAMTEVGKSMAPTEGLDKYVTKVKIKSVLNSGHIHPEGSLVVKLNELDDEGKIWLIEVQAKGWQECLEIESSQVERAEVVIA